MSEKPKILGFEKPIGSDWTFYIFLLFAISNSYGSYQSYFGGLPSAGSIGSVAFLLDIAFAVAFAYVEAWIIGILPRKIYRKAKGKKAD